MHLYAGAIIELQGGDMCVPRVFKAPSRTPLTFSSSPPSLFRVLPSDPQPGARVHGYRRVRRPRRHQAQSRRPCRRWFQHRLWRCVFFPSSVIAKTLNFPSCRMLHVRAEALVSLHQDQQLGSHEHDVRRPDLRNGAFPLLYSLTQRLTLPLVQLGYSHFTGGFAGTLF